MKSFLLGMIISVTLGATVSQAVCYRNCHSFRYLAGLDAGGDFYCHHYLPGESLRVYSEDPVNSIEPTLTGFTIQRASDLNCCDSDKCTTPPSSEYKGTTPCDFSATVDYDEHECVK